MTAVPYWLSFACSAQQLLRRNSAQNYRNASIGRASMGTFQETGSWTLLGCLAAV